MFGGGAEIFANLSLRSTALSRAASCDRSPGQRAGQAPGTRARAAGNATRRGCRRQQLRHPCGSAGVEHDTDYRVVRRGSDRRRVRDEPSPPGHRSESSRSPPLPPAPREYSSRQLPSPDDGPDHPPTRAVYRSDLPSSDSTLAGMTCDAASARPSPRVGDNKTAYSAKTLKRFLLSWSEKRIEEI
jgi:hypothetical protein